ncbi:glycosyl hydrolase family 95 catalytic domain-containing protein [Sphingobacterium prati]|uniref:glycoside hydrolase family 95 protein n=1 Tax=Sphingobacterium prati TaxID=2737006 RepID=UPI001557F573|nr:glycoside hydrolase family 95 protein [Sphingobacterium prati]NPE49046.1 glycoside hydrolase family 95 protein [Sphingobacterium prati]
MRLQLYILWSFLSICSLRPAFAQSRVWFDHPATQWEEALPIGNGHLGAMIYGGVSNEEIQFNEETLWTDGPRNYNKKGASAYLQKIRELLDQGRQKEAESLAMQEFMGVKSESEDPTAWLNKVDKIRKQEHGPFEFAFDDSKWPHITVPHYEGWEIEGLEGLDGAVWFRYEFNLSKNDLAEHWSLDLNKIRTNDYTYINGELVGHSVGDETRRHYQIPMGLLREGRNSIAIQVINLEGKGGVAGYKDPKQAIGLKSNSGRFVSLKGKWRYHIQDQNSPKIGSYQASYQPFGSLKLQFNHDAAENYSRILDLNKGEVRVNYAFNGVHYSRTYFASHPNNFIAVRLQADQKNKVTFRLAMNTKHQRAKLHHMDGTSIRLEVWVKNGSMRGTAFLQLKLKGGTISYEGDQLVVQQADEAQIYLIAATNFKSYQELNEQYDATALARFKNLCKLDLDKLYQVHQKDYQRLYHRFAIDLGASNQLDTIPTDRRLQRAAGHADPGLVALYMQFARYLQIAASREGSQPMNLQGIWNPFLEPSWGSKYTTNINLEMNYWPTEALNLSELQQPLFQMIQDLRLAGGQTAKEYYAARGWVLHHNTDIWRGTAPINNSNHGIWPTGGAWLVRHLWEHYQYTQDLRFLQQYYPIIKDATLFFKDFLVKDKTTGWWVSSPSNSPENGGLVKGPTMDHQIIRSLFDIFDQSSKLLGKDVQLRDSIMEMRDQIAPNQIGQHGQLQEWLTDLDDPENKHRHVSHLWGLFPGDEINTTHTSQLVEAAKRSLVLRGDEGTGWSLAWKINFWARLKDAQHAYHMVKMLLRPAGKGGGSYPNLFDAHPPFQIDGNFGGASGITEMLLQSHINGIELLPALPEEMSTGKVKGLRARGAFQVNMEWKDNQLLEVTVESLAGEELHLRYASREVKIKTKKGKSYAFDQELKLKK